MKKLFTGLLTTGMILAGGSAFSQCLPPSGLNVTNVTSTSATLNWTGTSGAYDVELIVAGGTATGTGTTVINNSYTFTGLNPNTNYTAYVRSNCDTIAPMLLTGVFDGPLTGGHPKVIEVYAIEAIPDLSRYGVGSANNGGGTDGVEFTFPAISVPAGTSIYIASDSAGFNNYFGFNADYIHSVSLLNGDDAIELFRDSVIIDVFGEATYPSGAGGSQPWNHLDGWAYRNNGTKNNRGTFRINEWNLSGQNATDNCINNLSCVSNYPYGSYTPALISNLSGWVSTNFGTCGIMNHTYTSTDVACHGDSTGSATITTTGGSSPYTYTWPNGQTGATQNNLGAGTYNVQVTDNNTCPDSIDVVITEPAQPLSGNAIATSNVSCAGDSDAVVDITPAGGTTPYRYNWNGTGNSTTSTLSNVPAGTHIVVVSDDNNCTFTDTVVVTEPAPIATTGTVNDNGFTGSIDATVTGGTAPYGYDWAGPNGLTDTTEDLNNLTNQGVYTLIVTDANGCTDTTSFTVAGSVTVKEHSKDAISIHPNPNSGNFTISGIAASVTSIEVRDVTGRLVFSSPASMKVQKVDLSSEGKGLYFITIRSGEANETHRVSVY